VGKPEIHDIYHGASVNCGDSIVCPSAGRPSFVDISGCAIYLGPALVRFHTTANQSHSVKSNAKVFRHIAVVPTTQHCAPTITCFFLKRPCIVYNPASSSNFIASISTLSHRLPTHITQASYASLVRIPLGILRLVQNRYPEQHQSAFASPTNISTKSSTTIKMFHIRLSSEKAEPKPYYYDRMNPQELAVWEIIVSNASLSKSSP
jgi:hypothetical protein